MNKTKKIILWGTIAVMGLTLVGCNPKINTKSGPFENDGNEYYATIEEKTLSKSVLRDKIAGGVIGHVLGLGSGFEYLRNEDGSPWVAMDDKYWEPNGSIACGTLGYNYYKVGPYEDFYQRVFEKKVKSDDDITIDFFNQWILEKCGPNVSHYDISKYWRDYEVGDAAGGEMAMQVMKQTDYIAPYVGTYAYGNTLYFATEPWIENETLGMLFPAMPASAYSLVDLFAGISGDCYGLYLGKLMSVAYSYAMTERDARVALEKAFTHMEKDNDIYTAYEYVKQCYAKNPQDWRSCVLGLVEQHQGHRLVETNDQIALDVNAGFMFTAVVFGENDYERSLKISSLAGYDGDCTAATVGGLMGVCHGYNAMPEKYRDYLGEDSIYINDRSWFSHIGGDYPDQETFGKIIDRYVSNMEEQIVANGGKIKGNDYVVKAQTVEPYRAPRVTNYGFRNGNTDGWLTEECDLTVAVTAHTGKYGGAILQTDTGKDAKVYQNLNLRKGDTYHVIMYISAEPNKEMRLFAGSGKTIQARAYTTPIMSLRRHLKTELTFTADSDTMPVGIWLPADEGSSNILYIDDLFVENITGKVAQSGSLILATDCETTSKTSIIKDKNAMNGQAVRLSKGGKMRFSFEGEKNIFQSFRVYYSNPDAMATVKVSIDGEYCCVLPLIGTGKSGFAVENWSDIDFYVGEGTHTMTLELSSNNDIDIERIEVRIGDIGLRQGNLA